MTQLTPPQAFHEAQRLIRMGDFPRAAGLTQQLVQNIPDEPAIRGLHGIATARMGLPENGLRLLAEACEKAESSKVLPFLLTEKAWVLRTLNRPEEARQACEAAREADPEFADLPGAMAECLIDLGRYDEARSVLGPSKEDEPVSAAAARGRLALLTERPDDAADELARVCERVGVAAIDLERILRLLGELRELQGRFDDAARAYRRAAKLRRADYDPKSHRAMVDEIISGWTPAAVGKLQRSDVDGSGAVFFFGLPGAGQDVAERVVASHPSAFGGGELMTLTRVARGGLGAQRRSFRHVVPRPNLLKGKQLKAAGSIYMARLAEFGSQFTRVTNANVLNDYLAGLVPLMLQGAHVVFCLRTPAEAAFAWFASIPGPTHPYAQDTADLMDAMEDRSRLMEHWRVLFDAMGVPVHEFSLERFAEAPEREAKALVEAVGLSEDPRCAEPHIHAKTRIAPPDILRMPVSRWAKRWDHFRGLFKPGFDEIGGSA
ncbi:MAG: hypothetical protein Kow0022_14330 [Phycisphaerales bacterium]